MGEFFLGLFILAVAATGNAGTLLNQLKQDGGFIPWIVSIGVLYWVWENTPAPERKPVRALIAAGVAAILVGNYNTILGQVTSLWTTIKNFGNGGFGNMSAAVETTGVSAANQAAFLQSIQPYVQSVASQTGAPPAAIAAQAALETGWGTSSAWLNNNNPTGINVAGAATGENYQSYGSPAAGFQGLANLLNSQYPQALNGSVQQYASGLQQGGYATDPAYAQNIVNVANSPIIGQYFPQG